MNRKTAFLLVICMLLSVCFCASAENVYWREFYVSVDGNDGNPGTQAEPFKTIEAAKNAVRLIKGNMQGDIKINIMSGEYFLNNTIYFGAEDSGENGYKIIYSGDAEGKTILSGGKQINGFTKSEYENIYVADVDEKDGISQLSVNSVRRYMAKSATRINGQPRPEKYQTDEWYEQHPNDVKGNLYGYYNPDTEFSCDGFYASKKDLGIYENPEDMIYRTDCYWVTMYLPFNNIEQDPDVEENVRVTMAPVVWDTYAKRRWTSSPTLMWPNAQKRFTVMNAFELLDEPGEFYYNKKTHKLYYMPFDYENMETAVVIVPQLGELMYIEGNDIDDKVENLKFSNLQFQDTKWNWSGGYIGDQAPVKAFYDDGGRAIRVRRANNIEFSDNVFCNIGDTALDVGNASTNCTVVGNAFYDIGQTAIVGGQPGARLWYLGDDFKSEPVPEKYKNAPVDLMMDSDTKIYSSNYLGGDGAVSASKAMKFPGDLAVGSVPAQGYGDSVNKTYIDENYALSFPSNLAPGTLSCNVWRDDVSAKQNKNPYAIYEFARPYSLSEVTLSFKSDRIKEGENADYEILGSNDKNFSDGTYDILATQVGKAPNEVNKYEIASEKKYKYVMVRKTTASDFALSRVWIGTYDRKPYVKVEKGNHVEISNNYLKRIGVDMINVGIMCYDVHDYSIMHNELDDISYSGISVGWSWNSVDETCKNIEVGYNSVNDTNHTGMDGAGIYTLGPQPGSKYHHNLVREPNIADKGFYSDNGTRYVRIEDNVFELVHNTLAPYTEGILDNVFKNNFSTSNKYYTPVATQSFWEIPKTFIFGQPQEDSYDTYAHAGLEDKYKYIKNKVPEGRNNLYSKYDNRYDSILWEGSEMKSTLKEVSCYELKNLLDNGKFGDGLGMYPFEYKQKVSDTLNYLNAASTSDPADWTMRYIKAREFIKELEGEMRQYSLEETLKICEDELKFAKENISPADGKKTCDKYVKTIVDEFEKSINTAKEKISAGLTGKEEYKVLVSLEDAYNKIEGNRNYPVIKSVNIPGAEYVTIDNEARTVTAYATVGSNLVFDNVEINVNDNSIVATKIESTMDLSKPVIIPVYCSSNKKYRMWTFNARYITPENKSVILGNDFRFDSVEKNLIKNTNDGTVLPASAFAYMADACNKDGETTVNFKPLTNNAFNSFSIILGADICDNFEYHSKDSKFNRCEVEFKDGKAYFYKVDSGEKTLLNTADSNILWNEKNTLTFKTEKINESYYYKINMNGTTIFSKVLSTSNTSGKFFGVYSPNINMKIYN